MKISIDVKFLGGVADNENLTGSCTLVTIRRGKSATRLLIDAGLLQCDFANLVEKNQALINQLDPTSLNYIILTHSHVDHVGRLPFLVKKGFNGQVICTESTNDLLKIILPDTAKIQASEARYLRSRAAKKARQAKEKYGKKNGKYYKKIKKSVNDPLFSIEDVERTYELIKIGGFPYFKQIKLSTGIHVKFYPSGHVLGGAICVIQIMRPGSGKHINMGFSGDLGRQDGIILPSPEIVQEPINYWFIESTYGGKKHPERNKEIDKLLGIITRAAKKKQKIIIPSFALERTQEIVYLLSYYMHIKEIPAIPIYLDSPMASNITRIYGANWLRGMFKDQAILPFNPFIPSRHQNPYFKIITQQDDSANLSREAGPYIVIAGSGMCNAGRVRNHLRAGLGNSNTVVCLIGYMAKGTLGRKLQEGLPIIKMNDEDIFVKSEIIVFESFSAHADSPFLVHYTNEVMTKNSHADTKIFIIHGEEKSGTLLKLQLANTGVSQNQGENIIIPRLNQTIKIL